MMGVPMRILFVSLVAMLAPVAAHAQYGIYTDLNIGIGLVNNIHATFDIDDGVDRFVGDIDAGVENALAAGFEVGLRGVFSKHISLSASYDYVELNLESIAGSVSENGGPAMDFPEMDVRDLGFDLDTETHTFLGNVRYDFLGPKERLQPWVSVGGGGTIINDFATSPTLGVSAGVRTPLAYGFYAGVRYRYLRVFSGEDELGFELDGVSAHLISFTLGAGS